MQFRMRKKNVLHFKLYTERFSKEPSDF